MRGMREGWRRYRAWGRRNEQRPGRAAVYMGGSVFLIVLIASGGTYIGALAAVVLGAYFGLTVGVWLWALRRHDRIGRLVIGVMVVAALTLILVAGIRNGS